MKIKRDTPRITQCLCGGWLQMAGHADPGGLVFECNTCDKRTHQKGLRKLGITLEQYAKLPQDEIRERYRLINRLGNQTISP